MKLQTVKRKFSESRLSDRKVVLSIQAALSLFSLLVFYYFSSGSPELRFVLYIVSPLIILPPISTYAYYKGFERSSKYSLCVAALFPVIGTFMAFLASAGLGILVLMFWVFVISVIAPYLILGGALVIHYWKKLKEK